MQKIKLSKGQKQILRTIASGSKDYPKERLGDLSYLEQEGLVTKKGISGNKTIIVHITDYGIAYLNFNPELNNPSIFDDRKWIINTLFTLVTMFLSMITLYFTIK